MKKSYWLGIIVTIACPHAVSITVGCLVIPIEVQGNYLNLKMLRGFLPTHKITLDVNGGII